MDPLDNPVITVEGKEYPLFLTPRDFIALCKQGIDLLTKYVPKDGADNLTRTAEIIATAAHSDDLTGEAILDKCSLAEIVNAGTVVIKKATAGIVPVKAEPQPAAQ